MATGKTEPGGDRIPTYVPPKPKPKPKPKHHGHRGPSLRDPLTPYMRGASNTAADQATVVVLQFLSIMGYPAGIDATKLALALLKQGLELSPARAYNWLYTRISAKLQAAHPNAEFGMTQDSYVNTVNAFKDHFETLTGNSEIPHDILRMAIDQQWTDSELTRFLQHDKRYSDPAQLPWLQQGMTFKDVKNQFFSTYGKNPTDPTQLASWFSFRQGAQQVGSSQVAGLRPNQGPAKGGPSQSEVR